jgi:diadenosine tetraphosphate (Ap4A) HIT family hydrolase
MNETIRRFGWPETLVAEYDHWVVLLRPQQPTLGSLVIASRSDAEAFSDLYPPAFAELSQVVSETETALRDRIAYDKINYLMLMMVDRHVHFHVIPRYDGERRWEGLSIADAGWPKLPDLASSTALDEAQVAGMAAWLKDAWPG